MLVDDEPDIITYLAMILEDAGYSTVFASDTESALPVLRKSKPDLLCLDIMMPRRSGISMYTEIKKDPELKDIPVLIVSAFSRLDDFVGERFKRIVPEQGVPQPEAFIEKPIRVETFLEMVKSLLSGSNAGGKAGT